MKRRGTLTSVKVAAMSAKIEIRHGPAAPETTEETPATGSCGASEVCLNGIIVKFDHKFF